MKSGELKDIVAIPTSIRTKEQAESLGIPLVTLDSHSGKCLAHMNALLWLFFFAFVWRPVRPSLPPPLPFQRTHPHP